MMENRKFNLTEKKTKFIKDHLLSDLMNRIEGDNSKASQIASMYIFPYRTNTGVNIGSLTEPGISWYYAKDKKDTSVSTDSYRILADSALTAEQAKKFRQTFSETGHVSEFSETVVIKDLLKKMSQEKDYTSKWWKYAYDLLKIWNPEKFNDSLSEATSGIDNNSFLFCDDYCDTELKKKLIKNGVFQDIRSSVSDSVFWDKIQNSEMKKAIKMIKSMGVPNQFTYYQYFRRYEKIEGNKLINKYILNFIERIACTVKFPVSEDDKNYELCNFCYELVTKKISKESLEAFCNAAKDDNNYADGIVVRNLQNQFVPIAWDLFYEASKEEVKHSSEYADEPEYLEEEMNDIDFEGEFESLHIEQNIYSEIISRFDSIHDFAGVDGALDDYTFDINGDEINFYKWLWNYTQHEELIENILYYFSGDEDVRATVSGEDIDFVFTILKRVDVKDQGYDFDIDISGEKAFENAKIVNRITLEFDGIYTVIDDKCEQMKVDQYISRIVNETDLDLHKKSEILNSEIWQHVYQITELNGTFSNEYISAKRYLNEEYEDVIFLCPSEDENSYIRALAKYIQDKYQIVVSAAEAVTFDWKNEYLRLIKDIRTFMSDKHDIRQIEDTFGHTVNMADITDFGNEKKVWLNLLAYREKIVSCESGEVPVNLEGWRDFLAAKYKGRCQLCGEKIPMSEQKSYFWTFRMVKESDNRLANLKSNLFCLCPACHGEMRYGNYMGKDMSEIIEKSQKYAQYIQDQRYADYDDESDCLIQEIYEENDEKSENYFESKGFHKPIVCSVIVNGKKCHMAFSWEHFMRLAFVFSEINDYNEDEINDDAEGYYETSDDCQYQGKGLGGSHEYQQWHGTEYVNGHWRTRNGYTEWVRGHWRTK